jgi:hypothetical protein
MNAGIRKRNNRQGHRDSGSEYQVEMERPYGRNGPAQMGAPYSGMGLKGGKKENW